MKGEIYREGGEEEVEEKEKKGCGALAAGGAWPAARWRRPLLAVGAGLVPPLV